MKKRFVIAVAILLLLQLLMFLVVWDNPQLKLERSYTATPSATPIPPAPTLVGPTAIPTLIPVWQGAPTRQVDQVPAKAP